MNWSCVINQQHWRGGDKHEQLYDVKQSNASAQQEHKEIENTANNTNANFTFSGNGTTIELNLIARCKFISKLEPP